MDADVNNNAKTKVTLPDTIKELNVSGKTSVELTTTVYPVEEAVTNKNFTVTGDNNTTVAAIDLKLTVGDAPVSKFMDTSDQAVEVTVETYILKGLNSVSVKYNGTDGVQPSDITLTTSDASEQYSANYYESDTGKLVFTTTHFSEFFVVSDAVCYSEKKGKGYSNLIDAAAESSSDDIIHLLSDIDFSNYEDNDDDYSVINKLYGVLDGAKNGDESFKILMPTSETISYFINHYSNVTISNISVILGERNSIVSLLYPHWVSENNVVIDNVDYSSSELSSYTIGHNSSVYGSYFTHGGSVTFKNCDVMLNLDGTQSKANANMAVFYGGYHFGPTSITVENCSYSGEFIGPYVALVLSNGQGITSSNTSISGLVNNGSLFGFLGANVVGAQNPSKTITFEAEGKDNITKAEDSNILITKDNDQVTFTASSNSQAHSYIIQLAGVRKVYNSGNEYAQNYNYDIRFNNVKPNEPTPIYRMVDIDTAKTKYDFTNEDFEDITWSQTGSKYDGNGEYCVAEKNNTKYYVIKFESNHNGDTYSIDTIPSQINVMVLDSAGKLIEIKTSK